MSPSETSGAVTANGRDLPVSDTPPLLAVSIDFRLKLPLTPHRPYVPWSPRPRNSPERASNEHALSCQASPCLQMSSPRTQDAGSPNGLPHKMSRLLSCQLPSSLFLVPAFHFLLLSQDASPGKATPLATNHTGLVSTQSACKELGRACKIRSRL